MRAVRGAIQKPKYAIRNPKSLVPWPRAAGFEFLLVFHLCGLGLGGEGAGVIATLLDGAVAEQPRLVAGLERARTTDQHGGGEADQGQERQAPSHDVAEDIATARRCRCGATAAVAFGDDQRTRGERAADVIELRGAAGGD